MAETKGRAVEAFGSHSSALVEDERPAYERARERSSERLMLQLRFATGRSVSFSYSYLTHTEYEPGDVLRLHFGRTTVTIAGRRLAQIESDIREHRIKAIFEGTESEEALKSAEAAFVESITIEGDEV